MIENDHVHLLSDGRKLAYMEYGDPKGFPLLAFHGTPGSRLWFSSDDEISKTLSIRLITVDRPGYGNSDQKAGRTFTQFAEDIRELSMALGLEKFSVMGVSGGGAYAAACAHQLPDLIHKAGLIASADEFENGRPPREMTFVNRITFTLARKAPWLVRYVLNQQKKALENPDRYVESIRKNTGHLCASDRAIIAVKENAEEVYIHMKEAFKNGVEGAVTEMRLFCNPWGFDLGEINIPVELWHGTDDTLVPLSSAQSLSRKIPNCQTHFVEGKGHFLTDEADEWREILSSLRP